MEIPGIMSPFYYYLSKKQDSNSFQNKQVKDVCSVGTKMSVVSSFFGYLSVVS